MKRLLSWLFARNQQVEPRNKQVEPRNKQVEPRDDAEIFQIGGGWGNSIQWQNWERRSIVGWKYRTPETGDILRCQLTRGWARFVFTKIDRCMDPKDMFFADVRDLGYEADLEGQ